MVDESEHGANRLRRTRFLISSSIVRLYSVFGGVAGTSAVTCGEGARGSLDFASTALSLASTRSSCSRRLISCAFSWSISDSCAEAAVQVKNSKNAKATVSRMTVLRGMTKNATRADTREHPHVDTLGLGSKGTSSGWMLVAGDCRKMNAVSSPAPDCVARSSVLARAHVCRGPHLPGAPPCLRLAGWVFSQLHSTRNRPRPDRGSGTVL